MESEVLYKFMNNHGIEISAYLNFRKDTVVYWVSDGPHFESIKSILYENNTRLLKPLQIN